MDQVLFGSRKYFKCGKVISVPQRNSTYFTAYVHLISSDMLYMASGAIKIKWENTYSKFLGGILRPQQITKHCRQSLQCSNTRGICCEIKIFRKCSKNNLLFESKFCVAANVSCTHKRRNKPSKSLSQFHNTASYSLIGGP